MKNYLIGIAIVLANPLLLGHLNAAEKYSFESHLRTFSPQGDLSQPAVLTGKFTIAKDEILDLEFSLQLLAESISTEARASLWPAMQAPVPSLMKAFTWKPQFKPRINSGKDSEKKRFGRIFKKEIKKNYPPFLQIQMMAESLVDSGDDVSGTVLTTVGEVVLTVFSISCVDLPAKAEDVKHCFLDEASGFEESFNGEAILQSIILAPMESPSEWTDELHPGVPVPRILIKRLK